MFQYLLWQEGKSTCIVAGFNEVGFHVIITRRRFSIAGHIICSANPWRIITHCQTLEKKGGSMVRRPSGQSLTGTKAGSIPPPLQLTSLLLRPGKYDGETNIFDQLAKRVRG
jgi:hypothetical protein